MELQPNTPEWYLERLGKFTGSAMHRLMGYPDADKLSKGAETYVMECVAEEIAGESEGFSGNANTEHGHTYEPDALKHYEIQTLYKVSPGQLIINCKDSGCTPDGMTGGLIGPEHKVLVPPTRIQEVKCPPKKANHLKYFLLKEPEDLRKAESQYFWQVHFNSFVSKAPVCDFITFHPHFPGFCALGILEIPKDEERQGQLANKLKLAKAMKAEILSSLMPETAQRNVA